MSLQGVNLLLSLSSLKSRESLRIYPNFHLSLAYVFSIYQSLRSHTGLGVGR